MASNMDWSPDFCIICDTQMSEGGQGVYCSQACRLAELERSGTTVGSPTASHFSTSASSTSSAGGFYLPPAFNFSAAKQAPAPSRGFDMGHYHQQYHPAHYVPRHASTFSASASAAATSPSTARQLSPSSSRSSLSSTSSNPNGISAQAATQLTSYVRSFDQVREMRRRHH